MIMMIKMKNNMMGNIKLHGNHNRYDHNTQHDGEYQPAWNHSGHNHYTQYDWGYQYALDSLWA